MTAFNPHNTRSVRDPGPATSSELDLWTLQVEPEGSLEPDVALDLPSFAYLEAIYRLTMGVTAAWADSVAVDRAFAVLMIHGRRGVPGALARDGYIEELRPGGHAGRWAGRGIRRIVRMTGEGAVEHFSQRPVLLPLLVGAGRKPRTTKGASR